MTLRLIAEPPYTPRAADRRQAKFAGFFALAATAWEVKWPRAAGPFLAAAKLEVRLLVVLYQAAKDSVCAVSDPPVGMWSTRLRCPHVHRPWAAPLRARLGCVTIS